VFEKTRAAIAEWLSPQTKAAAEAGEEAVAFFSARSTTHRPPKRGTSELLKAYSEIPQLRAVVQKITESFASIRWTVHKAVDANGRPVRARRLERMPHAERTREFSRLRRQGDLVEVGDDPLLDFLDRGNALLSGFECRQVMAAHFDLVGEAFAWIERNPMGMPIAYWPLPAHWVRDVPAPGWPLFKVRLGGGVERHVPEADIWYIRDPDPFNPYGRGVGIGATLGDELDTSEYISEFLKAFFFNDATPSLVVAYPSAENVGDDAIKELEQRWSEKHRGAQRASVAHFLNKEPKITEFGQSFKDMSVVELNRYLRDIVRETWGVPPEILGLVENSNRATIDAASYIFAVWVQVPRAERWRISIQVQIAPQFDARKIVGYESPVPSNNEHLLAVATAQPSARTKNEWREMQDLEPDETGGDVYLEPVAVNRVPVGEPPAPSAAMIEESRTAALGARTKVPGIEQGDIDRVLMELQPEPLRESVEELWPDELRAWGDDVLEDVNASVSFDMRNPLVTQHISETAGDRIDMIDDTTRDELRRQLVDGVEIGEDYQRLAKRVSEVFGEAETWRAERIARTEVHRSTNFATQRAFEQSGLVDKKEWISTPDSRVREQHLAMDGQIRALNKPFTFPDGTVTMFPGESGVAKHDVNCRCSFAAFFEEDETRTDADRRALGEEYHAKVTKWEAEAKKGYKRGFRKQRASVQEQLRRMAESHGRV
jgi:SPP1 gp7 family putative phage head morphogenesis protein